MDGDRHTIRIYGIGCDRIGAARLNVGNSAILICNALRVLPFFSPHINRAGHRSIDFCCRNRCQAIIGVHMIADRKPDLFDHTFYLTDDSIALCGNHFPLNGG